ncbi:MULTISPECIES: RadC family protein [Enterococcus]|jgi:DNA repair protein RadC|uniref:DNA repair protein RadC n=1 Tax=Enterococcus dispar ATCC 51266 TaxID=1139219 RepID=S1P1M2_9ENTE|nr:DNA repair protein RadC [Enterococcus dispar]EOT41367.1 DNA repair protein RadC [Enterococcus dispar ATCC 51266]EOW86999.1 DNA repair protein RadC [Enterococcus dispar ATCC 51266]MCU7356755.1 DNA repair protein RadC [Enterococcus dispar]OJG38098.1 DNA repair protein RadC [Enterococcus dispar]WCG33947.1 DNA repair protein RadC [Enterococcus dispar]
MKIKTLPLNTRPRERLKQKGASALSDQELLAIILRTGSKKATTIELAAEILNFFGDLHQLKTAELQEFMLICGIGEVKAIELLAMIELGHRISKSNQLKMGHVSSSYELGCMLAEEMRDYEQEHLLCIYLNTKNQIIQKRTIFIGSLNQSIAHPREIFKTAVKVAAARIVICHNHPSGSPTPSHNDIAFTKRLKECGELMGIELLDHLVIGGSEYISLREEGLWN